MDAQESQVENKDDKDVKDRNENMAIFTEKLKAELHQRTEQLLGKFTAADIELDQALELAVRDLFANVSRPVLEAADEMQHADATAARKQLRSQRRMSSSQLQISRTASQVSMSNQKMELQAQHDRALEEKEKALSGTEGSALADANKLLEEKLQSAALANKSTEEALRKVGDLHQAAEAELKKATAELRHARTQLAQCDADAMEAEQLLNLARKDTQLVKDENVAITAEMQELGLAYDEAKKRCAALEHQLANANRGQGDGGELSGQLSARITTLEQDCELLRKEIAKAVGSFEPVLDYLQGSSNEHMSLHEKADTLVHGYTDAKSEVESCLRQTRDGQDILELAMEKRFGKKTLGDQVRQLVAQYTSERKEFHESRDSLEDALADLDIFKKENQTLAERIRELIAAYENGRQRIAMLENDPKTGAARELREARAETLRLQTEMDKASDTISQVLSDLNITKKDNMTLVEQVTSLADSHMGAKTEIERYLKEVRESQDALQSALGELNLTKRENLTLGEQVQELVSQHAQLRKEIREGNAMLNDALKDLDLTHKTNRTLKERIQELVTAFESSQRDIAQSKATLEDALKDLNITRTEKMTLAEQIREIIRRFEQAKRESVGCRAELENTLRDLEVTLSEKKSLVEHMNEMLTQYEELKSGAGQAHFKLMGLQKEIAESKAENRRLGTEIKQMQVDLYDKSTSVDALSEEKLRLTENLRELSRRYRSTKQELEMKVHEYAQASKLSMEAVSERDRVRTDAEARIRTIQQESLKERTALVGAALRSMNELRTHMALQHSSTASMHVQGPLLEAVVDDKLAFVSWKSRWSDGPNVNVRAARPQSSRAARPQSREHNGNMSARLLPPGVLPLNVRPSPPSGPQDQSTFSPRDRRARAATAPETAHRRSAEESCGLSGTDPMGATFMTIASE
jgi:chromosome segregation ATPase